MYELQIQYERKQNNGYTMACDEFNARIKTSKYQIRIQNAIAEGATYNNLRHATPYDDMRATFPAAQQNADSFKNAVNAAIYSFLTALALKEQREDAQDYINDLVSEHTEHVASLQEQLAFTQNSLTTSQRRNARNTLLAKKMAKMVESGGASQEQIIKAFLSIAGKVQ